MVIMSPEESRKNKDYAAKSIIEKGDLLNTPAFNSLPGPVTAKMFGGDKWWIVLLDMQTGCMHLDVCGKIQLSHFDEVAELIDIDGFTHDPDEFWLSDAQLEELSNE